VNSRNLFYIRYLQRKFYFSRNKLVLGLFSLEEYLFDNFKSNEEIPLSKLKQKWIFDNISEGDFSNEITSKLKVFNDKSHKNKILDLIETFIQFPEISDQKKFIKSIKSFNSKFNNLLKSFNVDFFETSYLFQLTQLIYRKNLNIQCTQDDLCFEVKRKPLDLFELVFIEIFLKQYIRKEFKITKSYYLAKLLLKFIYK
jgi:hypothetical protein